MTSNNNSSTAGSSIGGGSLTTLIAIYFIIIYSILNDQLCGNVGVWLFVSAITFLSIIPVGMVCACCMACTKRLGAIIACCVALGCVLLFMIVWHIVGSVWAFKADRVFDETCHPVIYWTGFVWEYLDV